MTADAPGADLAQGYVNAFNAEQADSTAAGGYLDLLDRAIANPDDAKALPSGLAALGALVLGSLPGQEHLGPHAIAYRSREGLVTTVPRLERAWAAAGQGPTSDTRAFLRGRVASALYDLALFVGNESAANVWRERRGCVMSAAVIGPINATALRALDDPSPIANAEPLRATYAGVPPFAGQISPRTVFADQCRIDARRTSPLLGLRAVVVDLIVPRAQRVHLAFSSTSAAVVDAGGLTVLRRPFDAGGRTVTRLATFSAPEGRLRVVARVAERGEAGPLEINAWDENGDPIASVAPAPGDTAGGVASDVKVVNLGAPTGVESLALYAAAHLSLGDGRAAEHLLEAPPSEGGGLGRSAAIDLLYARAVEEAEDLPDSKALERVRGATNRALQALPGSWEARVGHARATERRKGAGEGLTDALRELGVSGDPSSKSAAAKDPMVLAAMVTLGRRGQLLDVARGAYASLVERVPGAPMLGAIDRSLFPRAGQDAVAAACDGGVRRADLACFEARRDMGDLPGSLAEMARLRRLRGSPTALREQELSLRVLHGDALGALAIYDTMGDGERRMLDTLGLLASHHVEAARSRTARDRTTARDAPYGLSTLARALQLEPDPSPQFEAEADTLIAADHKAAFLPGAATAVLRHVEKYTIDAFGLVHFIFYDLRRVSGTSDVAQGGVAYGPTIEGRTSPRVLRKRIHKPDGRTLEPDPAANASQTSDLSQLQTGDYIEHVAEGYALPGDTGQLVIDTPDLLPERTSVREAIIEIRRASSIPFTVWSHRQLGAPTVRTEGAYRVEVWRLDNQAPRRIEDGVPKTERSVSVSLGTQTWADVGRAFQENTRAYDENDPTVARWVRELRAAAPSTPKALIDRLVTAVGKAVRVASGGELSDTAALYSGGSQHMTARSTLEQGQGSRSWFIYRALRELSIKADLAVAETEPWSSAVRDAKSAGGGASDLTESTYPAHGGRFRHPLVVAHLGGADGDIWIDADVDGPPLPPGRISPELRGRTAMIDSGAMVTVEGTTGETGDEVDVRIHLDDKGDAKGSLIALLHGRTAQGLADAFETVVGTDRTELLRNVVLGWLPWADVEDVWVSSTDGSWEVAVRASIAIHGFGRPEGKDGRTWVLAGLEPVHTMFPRPGVATLGATYASRGARQNALSIDAPIQYHLHRRIELPNGASVILAPPSVDVSDRHIQARRKQRATQGVLDEDYTINLPTGTVAPAAYQGFVERVQGIDDGFLAGTRIRVKQ